MISNFLYGGLGNQLFQCSAVIAHAKRNGYEYEIPKTVINPHYKDQPCYNFPGVNYADSFDETLSSYKEPYFHYCEIPPMDNIRLDGYFQSSLYFNEFKDELAEAFGLEVKKIIQRVCGVHVRRGDYVRFPEHHPPQGMVYCYEAIGRIYQSTGIRDYVICSDDIPWCKETFDGLRNFNLEFREGHNEVDDLKFLSSCSHQIGSNSSFSWWAHYLNPNPDKMGVFPRKWFGPALPNDTKDLFNYSMVLI